MAADGMKETYISVLSAQATKRDAKLYLKTFASKDAADTKWKSQLGQPTVPDDSSRPFQASEAALVDSAWLPHVAIIKFVDPASWDHETLQGLAKTMSQLNLLGLQSIIVIDFGCSSTSWFGWRNDMFTQIDRVQNAISAFGQPGAKTLDRLLTVATASTPASNVASATLNQNVNVGLGEILQPALDSGSTLIVPSMALEEETTRWVPVNADDVAYALTTALSGLQMPKSTDTYDASQMEDGLQRYALVDRLIILDSLGGIPRQDLPGAVRVFVNLEEELGDIKEDLANHIFREPTTSDATVTDTKGAGGARQQRYIGHIELARRALAVLPSSSSAVITTPREAANLSVRPGVGRHSSSVDFRGDVGTRKQQNPLIHNLLTDRPVYSASIPHGRLKTGLDRAGDLSVAAAGTTLIKRGMPVTIFPDPRKAPWHPPKPGWSGLRLTDMRIDLPRLTYLIEDSFERKLDVQHYLERVQNSIAGIIIAGEYEGGAILTWERPPGLDEDTAYREKRLVPYLDKFAVLKKNQGAGGVADIIFNAMVRDCFPAGVCWRSRKDNKVNKWYFERSLGVRKLPESNWTMFWTTPDVGISDQTAQDYEAVCRSVAPSWADRQKPAD
jgi:amino-acid N-acetyltransferase